MTRKIVDLRGSYRMTKDPTLDEILASICRIIADDEPANETTESRQDTVATARESAAQAPPRPSAAPSYAAPTSPPPRIAPADAAASTPPMSEEEIDSMLAHLRGTPRQPPAGSPRTEAAAASEPAPTLDAPRAAIEERGLLSAATTAAVDAAFDALARNGRTLEEVVSELLRPMLKTWLDENLPEMVERLVRAEIERVSRGRG
jgi:cell pole-organizing protein PopZ